MGGQDSTLSRPQVPQGLTDPSLHRPVLCAFPTELKRQLCQIPPTQNDCPVRERGKRVELPL